MRIDKVAGGISGYSFVDDDAEVPEEAEAPQVTRPGVESQQTTFDDEDEDEVAPAPVPTKTVATVKKVLKKAAPKA